MWVIIPDPLIGKQFPWVDPKPPMSEYLDWRENLSSGSKISKEKPIENFAIKYLERNFLDLHHVLCFPRSIPEKLGTNGKKKKAKFVSQLFTELFQKVFKEGIRAVLTDYDLYDHACLLNFELQEDIDPKRVVLFYSKANLILIVRVASSPDCINQESQNCSTDVKYFVYVNKPIIENKSLTVLGVVACPSVKRKDLEETLAFQFSCNFELFKVLFICKDELKSYETLHDWWRYEFFAYCSKNTCNKENEILFKQLIGLTMLIIAKHDESCPSLESNTQKQITSMVLNPEQIMTIYDCSLKKVITGGFGCGKSVVGKEIVKNFCTEAAKPSTLYYICCEHSSLFECEMKAYVDSLKINRNVKVVSANLFELWRDMCEKQEKSEKEIISLPELLQYLGSTAVNGSTTVNFVLDELSGEYVKEKHANQLKELFSSSLKESLVIFIAKSIEKHRSITNNGETQQMENNCFDEKKLGMTNFTLESSMRVTCCVQGLIDSAQKTISESSNVFYQAHKSLDQRKLNQEKIELNIGIETQNTLKSDEETKNRNFHATQEENLTKNLQESDDETYYDDDLDHAAKILNPQNVVESNNYMETYYGFKDGVSGHSIIGDKPKIIYLPFLNWEEERSAKILSIVLEKICFEEVRSTAVICNHMQEVQSVAYAIDIIEGYTAIVYTPQLQYDLPRAEHKTKVFNDIKKSKQNVLVADIRAMCGVESEVIIKFVQPEEYYLRYEIVDACARSNSYLVFLVLPSKVTASQKGGTVEDVLKNWLEAKVQKILIKVDDCKDEKELCIKKEQIVSINDQCNDFKDRGGEQKFFQYINEERFKINYKNMLM